MDFINYFDGLFNLGPAAILAVLVLAISYIIRLTRYSNRWIPVAVSVAGPILFQFIYDPALLAGKWLHPRFMIAVYGFIIAAVVWMVHAFVISKFEDWLATKGLFPKRLQSQSEASQFGVNSLQEPNKENHENNP
ncbi:MAG: hypothetical protein ACTHLW_06020 [Verrucomicrobiota bacterium]